jgi:hypothetical protein
MGVPLVFKRISDHETQIALREVVDIGRHDIEIDIRDAKPPGKRGRELVSRRSRNHSTPTDIFDTSDLKHRIVSVNVLPAYCTTDYDLVTTPGMVSSVTI